MAEQKLFSESQPELNIVDCSAPIQEAVTEMEALLGQVSVYEWSDYVVAAVTLPVNIPTRGPVGGIDVREREPIALLFHKTRYPHAAPHVWSDRPDFPTERLPHQSPLVSGEPPFLCLHRGSLDDWFAEHSLRDLVKRVQGWLCDAASGRLIRPEDDFEPTIILLEQEAGFAIYPPEQMAEIVEQRWERRNGRKGSTHLTSRVLYATDQTLSVRVKTTPLHRRAVKRVHKQPDGANIAPLAILIWPHQKRVTGEHFGGTLPSTFDSLVEFANRLGLALEGIIGRHLRWYPQPALLALILAIPRPQKLIGSDTSIEFLNFALPTMRKWIAPNGRLKPNTPVLALSNRQPVSTNMARRLSRVKTSTDGRVLLAGCGALGSKIGLHLARAGLTNLTLVDNKTVSPHNVIRHGLLADSVGKNKALALADVIHSLFQDETLPLGVKARPQNVIDVLFEEQQVVEETDWILDCTTSPAVLDALIDPRLPQLPPVMRSVIAHDGALGFLFAEGPDRNPRADDLQACVYNLAIDDDGIAEWLRAH